MAFTFALSHTHHDCMIKNGKLVEVQGAEEVKQRILVTLLHNWQEYFLNVPAGLPWYELLLGSKDKKIVEALVRKAVLSVPNVMSIIGLQITWPTEGRGLDVDMEVEVITLEGLRAISFGSNLRV